VVNRARVHELLDRGYDYDRIGATLGIAPGLAYLLATGLPADGSDAPAARSDRPGALPTSQHLANPEPADNTTSRDTVHAWVQGRVASDLQMRSAFAARRRKED